MAASSEDASATACGSSSNGPSQQVLLLPLPDPLEVTAAVESLYGDQLKPFGRILRKRLAERMEVFTAGPSHAADVESDTLREVCEACDWLGVENAEGGDFCVLLLGRVLSFVDVYSPHDCYPEALWAAAAQYFASLGSRKSEMALPGGRYSCAQALASRKLEFLRGRSLGQVCHIVQLAISRKKLLGYLNGTVVPYSKSQSKAKERCAERRKPFALMANGSAPYRRNLATWDSVRGCLREIFFSLVSEVGSGEVLVPLSNVKRLFRIRFRLELSETALGHAKLSELLQDPRLADICEVKLQGHGYVVVPKCFLFSSCYFPAAPAAAPSSFLPKSGIRPIHIAEELGYPAPPAGARGAPEVPAWCPPGSASNSAQMEEPTARSSQTAESSSSSTTCCHTGSEDAGAPASSHYEKNDKAVEKIRVSLVHELSRKADAEPEDDDWTKNIIKNSFIQFAIPPTPRPGSLLSRPRSHSLPKDMGSGKCVFETMCHAVSYRGARLGGPATCPSAAFAPTAEDHANPQDYEDLEWDTDFPETACRRNAHVEMMTPYAPSPEGTRPATPACCYCPTPSDSSPTTPTPTPTTVGSVPAPWQWLAPMEGAFGDGGYDFLNQPMADICASHGEEGHSFGDLNYIGFNY